MQQSHANFGLQWRLICGKNVRWPLESATLAKTILQIPFLAGLTPRPLSSLFIPPFVPRGIRGEEEEAGGGEERKRKRREKEREKRRRNVTNSLLYGSRQKEEAGVETWRLTHGSGPIPDPAPEMPIINAEGRKRGAAYFAVPGRFSRALRKLMHRDMPF